MTYTLYRIEDDSSTTFVSEHPDIVEGIAAGQQVVSIEDYDFSYGLFADGVRVASFADGRAGFREWARRNGRV